MKNKIKFLIFASFIIISIFSHEILALTDSNENDLTISSGIELDNVITLASSILALILFIITFVAYKRSDKKKLIYVSIAFLLFSIKGFLISSDIFFPNKGAWIDPIANFLDFVVLLSFFFGIITK